MTTELEWEPAKSETIEKFAYIAEYNDLVVVFRSGGSYSYANVTPDIVRLLRQNHAWTKVGAELRDATKHPVTKLGAIRTKPLKKKGRA